MSARVGMCPATLLADFSNPTADDVRRCVDTSLEAGASGLSAWTAHLELLGGIDRAAGWFASSGMAVPAIEAAVFWPNGSPADVLREARSLAAWVAALGATRVLAVCLEETLSDLDRARENLAVLVEHLSAAGAQICVEFLPWTAIADLETAWALVEPLGPGAGIVVDEWHWQRQPGGPRPELLAQIPGERIGYLQMCDAAPGASRDMFEAISGRLLPGTGVVDHAALLGILGQIGADPFIATEVFNQALLTELGQTHFAASSIESAVALLGATAHP